MVSKEFKASLWLPNGGNWNKGITCQSRYLEYRYRYYPGVGNGNPLQYPWLGNPMDRGAWWATAHGVAKSQTRLNGSTLTCASGLCLVTLGFGCCVLSSLEVPGKRGTGREKKEQLFNQRVLTGAGTCVHGSRDDWLRSARSDLLEPVCEPGAALLLSICASWVPQVHGTEPGALEKRGCSGEN